MDRERLIETKSEVGQPTDKKKVSSDRGVPRLPDSRLPDKSKISKKADCLTV